MTILNIQHIERSPDVMGGKPHIVGRRISVQNIVVLHLTHNWPIEKIGSELDLEPSQIYAALAYYYDHKSEIDLSIDEAGQRVEKTGTPLLDLLKRAGYTPDRIFQPVDNDPETED